MSVQVPYKSGVIKLLIFDLDGTLIDSAPDIIATVNGLMARRNLPSLPDDEITAAIGEGLRALVHKLFPEAKEGTPFKADLDREFLELYHLNMVKRTKPFSGVEEFLTDCPWKVAIVTNKTKALTDEMLAILKLDRFPWVRVFGADSLAQRKPHPLPLQEAMRAAGVEPHETLMIGDGIPDMAAAKAARVRAIAVEFGYLPKETLLALGATHTLPSYKDLKNLITKLNSAAE